MPANKSVETALAMVNRDLLHLTVGPHKATTGKEIPRADAQSAPQLAFNSTASAGSYIAVGLDLDAPFPSFAMMGPILHWLQPGLKPERTSNGTATLSASGTPFVANWMAPAPPPGSSAHRYLVLLYEQPADFDARKFAPAGGKEMGMFPRVRYDLGAFEKKANLGPVVAANYFYSK